MKQRWFETAHGPVPVWAEFERFAGRPGLLVIRGAFAQRDLLLGLQGALPDADVALVHLPGMHSPFFADSRPEVFAEAFDSMVPQIFRSPPLALGISMGGLVAFAMTTTRATIALDSPLSTEGLWPLRDGLLHQAHQSPALAGWIWQQFGVSPERPTLNRDYRPLLGRIGVPTRVLVAEDPLGQRRPVSRIPSLVSPADRDAYRGCARVRVTDAMGAGHNIPAASPSAFLALLREALRASAS